MKKKFYLLLFCLSISFSLYSQSTVFGPGNIIGINDFLGSGNNFNTNFRANDNLRMQIFNGAGSLTGNGATTDGFVGIGDFNFFAPLNLLHQHLNYNRSNFHQFTNLNTGNTATDGSLFGIEFRTATNPGVNYSLATIRQK